VFAWLRYSCLCCLCADHSGSGSLPSSSAGAPAAASRWQLPSRQWLAQQATAAGSAVGRGWQAVSSRSRDLSSHFNPLQTVAAKQESPNSTALDPTSSSQALSSRKASSSDSSVAAVHQAQPSNREQQPASGGERQLPIGAAAAVLQPSQQQQQQVLRQQEQPAAAAAVSPSPGVVQSSDASSQHSSRGIQAVLSQLRSSDSVVEMTKGQLAVLGAAASTVGAALGAVVVVLLRSGSGAAGASGT
jgi:hypothetical protein